MLIDSSVLSDLTPILWPTDAPCSVNLENYQQFRISTNPLKLRLVDRDIITKGRGRLVVKCERCGNTTHVERYDVDRFTGFLCDDCRDVWNEIRNDSWISVPTDDPKQRI